MKPSAATPKDLLDRATKIDVDHIKARLDQLDGALGKLRGFRTHQLPRHRTFLGRIM